MQVAIHSHSASARGGGGVLYLYAIAAALAGEHEVEVHYPATVELEAVPAVLPGVARRPRLRHAGCRWRRAWPRELCRLLGDLGRDLVAIQSLRVPRFAAGRRNVLICEFPLDRRLRRSERLRLRTFDAVIANSHFTAGWIRRRWQREAAVLQPPISPVAPAAKRPWILGLGRFAGGGRDKRQRELVALFRRLREGGGAEGWELHLAGFPGDDGYVAEVERAAEGLPVRLHLGLDRGALDALLGQASIFWHAVGLGVDPEAEPERLEHFGIATVEAMSAGAVPVVIDAGGQPEILGQPPAGVAWGDEAECLAATRRLIADEDERARLAAAARARAAFFSFENFAPRARQLLTGRAAAGGTP